MIVDGKTGEGLVRSQQDALGEQTTPTASTPAVASAAKPRAKHSYRCDVCGLSFNSAERLRNHMSHCQPKDIEETGGVKAGEPDDEG